jgi:putative acetyltransferase
MPLELERVGTPTDEARELIGELDAELAGPYAPEQRHGLRVERVFRPCVVFFVARLERRPVGCGGIVFEGGLAEVKRMYVRPHARGRGVARSILERLEEEARVRGEQRVVLETGDAQLAAVRLYERAGYTRCAAFGPYAAMLQRAIEHSVFFEKRLG